MLSFFAGGPIECFFLVVASGPIIQCLEPTWRSSNWKWARITGRQAHNCPGLLTASLHGQALPGPPENCINFRKTDVELFKEFCLDIFVFGCCLFFRIMRMVSCRRLIGRGLWTTGMTSSPQICAPCLFTVLVFRRPRRMSLG